jgi:WD40 repeat protein
MYPTIVPNKLIIVFSCSNDTTIKLWDISKVYDKQFSHDVLNMNSISTLNDDADYIRAIDFSSFNHSLYSCCDNGIVRQWDVNLETVIAEYGQTKEVIFMF